MKFIRQLPLKHLDLLNLRVLICAKGCPHCQCQSSIKSHGYLYGQPDSSQPDYEQAVNDHGEVTRALRFFAPIAIPIKAAGALSPFIGMKYFPIVAYAPNNFLNYYAR